MANRHLSRSIVLQTLFEWDFLSDDAKGSAKMSDEAKKLLTKNIKEFAPGLEDDTFALSLMTDVLRRHEAVDKVIVTSAPDWPLEKISVVDRNILRIGLTELLFGDGSQVPPKVAINEAIELAKTFGGENSSKFVNGVLGAVYKEMGEPGRDQVSKNKGGEPTNISKLPVETLGGALVYAEAEGKIKLAFVHDVFGYWTLSKGKLEEGENDEECAKRAIKEEIGLDIKIKEKLGQNEYVATHPQRGKTLKRVVYFLAESEYRQLELKLSGGLDDAKWFEISSMPELRIYNDIIPLIAKAIKIIS
jgi:transcription antitermination protein NusB